MSSPHEIKSIRPRHAEIIRLAFLGLKHSLIAEKVGISAAAVSCVLRSAIARAELARLQHAAELKLLDTPIRVRAALELDQAAMESLRFNRSVVNDATIDKKLRSKVASHFLDRLVFNKDPDAEEGSYREILRSLRTIEEQFTHKPVVIDVLSSAEGRGLTDEASDRAVPDVPESDPFNLDNAPDALDDIEFIKARAKKTA